jgi:chorismate mutase
MDTIQLDLPKIAAHLEGLEETIISKLIDRAQFCANTRIYEPGNSGFTDEPGLSLFDLRLKHQETMDALFGRFCVPEERPYTGNLPIAQRKVQVPYTGLEIDNYDVINVTRDCLADYLALIPKMCKFCDDGQYGSSVEHDVYAVQAIARRIHYGALYIAESKYRGAQEEYIQLIARNDHEELLQKLTRKEVEDEILKRIREKTQATQRGINQRTRVAIDPEIVVKFYLDTIIPLTKKGEILYLMNRRIK